MPRRGAEGNVHALDLVDLVAQPVLVALDLLFPRGPGDLRQAVVHRITDYPLQHQTCPCLRVFDERGRGNEVGFSFFRSLDFFFNRVQRVERFPQLFHQRDCIWILFHQGIVLQRCDAKALACIMRSGYNFIEPGSESVAGLDQGIVQSHER